MSNWKKGSRGKRYWLPDGKRDTPKNRLYGAKAEQAALAVKKQTSRGISLSKGQMVNHAADARATYELAKTNGAPGALLERLRGRVRRAEGASAAHVAQETLELLAQARRDGVLERLSRWAAGASRVHLEPVALEVLSACWAVALRHTTP
jgi:hypothetical protein